MDRFLHRAFSWLCLVALVSATLTSFSPAAPVLADHTPAPGNVTIAGNLQAALGCAGDWDPTCAATHLTYDAGDDVWQESWLVPAGSWEYKAALNDAWTENYGANAGPNGSNIALALSAESTVKFYYDHKSHWVSDDTNSVIAVVPGSFQSELGCAGDWDAGCLRSWLQDPDGDGQYSFETTALPAGDYEGKVAIDEDWAENYGQNGEPGGANIPFNVPAEGARVAFQYDPTTHILNITVTTGGLEPGDENLVREPIRSTAAEETFYFAMTDRFANGDPANDLGGGANADPLVSGTLPSDKGYYHGGDIAGLAGKLDYLEGLGVTAVWLTPPFLNRWVQGDGTVAGSTAGYHGYWQLDFTQIDPHFGTNQQMIDLIDAAHARGMKVFFDIILNHTADVIVYEEGEYGYRNKTDYPYQDASGTVFDDAEYAGTGTFPALDPATSFPYTPVFATAEDATAKTPSWLNNPIYYHNRGNSTFTGENSTYGDFYGLDDLFTEHPDVVNGLIDIHKNIITEFKVDGFRIDTVKHANDELWQAFVPAILEHAAAQGIPDFFLFGEVYSADPAFASHYSTALPFPAVLDFGFDSAAKGFASASGPTDSLRDFFASDDYYTDEDSNVYQLVKFAGNHDMGRVGHDIDITNPGADDGERLARMKLTYGLMFTTRGAPLIYYGDEQGFTGDGGDKDARQDMFPSQVASYNDDDLIGTDSTTADDNFDVSHPLYTALGEFAALRSAHPALQQGAQIHRYSEAGAGLYAFSRIDRADPVEYLVVLNNSETTDSATIETGTPEAVFTALYPAEAAALTAAADGTVNVSLEGLDFAVYRADRAIPTSASAPPISIDTPAPGALVLDRFEIAATVGSDAYAEVTFAVSIDGGDYQVIGVDDSAPYRVFYDAGGLASGAALSLKAIVRDIAGNLNAAKVAVVVGEAVPPVEGPLYAVLHYNRPDGNYGDPTTGDFNDYYGLHLWGDIDEEIAWSAPKPFLGEDDYGRFAWVKLAPEAQNVGFIVHRGDVKDGTTADRFFDPSATPEIWLKADDATAYASQAAAQGFVTIHYHNPSGDYTDWGLHLWGDAIDPSEGTGWTAPKPPTGSDEFGLYWQVMIQDAAQPLNFIIHRGDEKDPGPDQSFIPADQANAWIVSGDTTIYSQQGAALGYVTLHYHRPDGDYGDYTSSNYIDFWGMHAWGGAADPGWSTPYKAVRLDSFGAVFQIDLLEDAAQMGYILHRGDTKDPGPDQSLTFAQYGYEVWQLSGADPEKPYVLPILYGAAGNSGDISEQRAHWVSRDTIVWEAADSSADTYRLHYALAGGLLATNTGITGGSSLNLALDPSGLPAEILEKFPHLAGLPVLKINNADLELVPQILKGQIAVSAVDSSGQAVDATGLQIPGVLDDLYTYTGALGVAWEGDIPTIRVWAPTAQSVKLQLFANSNPETTGAALEMVLDPASGVWSITGEPAWKGQYYLFEVSVYVHSTGAVELNRVTDPYSVSLAMNSTRSQIVNLRDAPLKPIGWERLKKPKLSAPEDISIYEIHIRDFSASDPKVPEELKGTFKAFTLKDTYGIRHLKALVKAGLTHLHLLPAFDIATINEDKSEWVSPDPAELAAYPPDSDQQQAAIGAVADQDAFNWGYDPYHYTVPEGSYSTNPDGPTRIVEFREMVQSLNKMGLRVVMDVVYNHTNSSGQAPKSVLDRIVPGYYHRLNDSGGVETSTCCANTASEHAMMEKLMIDSLVTWARDYKVDAFRFDLMGHHMVSNMQNVRAALDALTLEKDGVDGKSIYLYGEGWNFGEVADNARGENATQFNMAGTGIGTFNDRSRDAVRGIGPFDGGETLLQRQGFANGSYYDSKSTVPGTQEEQLATLLLQSDQVRVGMAGNLAGYQFIDRFGNLVTGSQVDYNGSPAGYNADPQEDISYVSKHDNQTLYDINVYAAPQDSTLAERVRMQNVGLSTVLLGQGVPFIHAGSDLLRSKSLDRDSYNSGDWFNTLDFTYQDNNFGVGLPPAGPNEANWEIMSPFLADPGLVAGRAEIKRSAGMFQELLKIRYSSPLFRLQTAEEVQARQAFLNTGPDQLPGLIVMALSDVSGADLDPKFERVVVLVNANDEAQTFTAADLAGKRMVLHPVQRASVDPIVRTARFTRSSGSFVIPARTTAVFVEYERPGTRISRLIEAINDLIKSHLLSTSQVWKFLVKLQSAAVLLVTGQTKAALTMLNGVVTELTALINSGVLTVEIGEPLIDALKDIIWQIANSM